MISFPHLQQQPKGIKIDDWNEKIQDLLNTSYFSIANNEITGIFQKNSEII